MFLRSVLAQGCTAFIVVVATLAPVPALSQSASYIGVVSVDPPAQTALTRDTVIKAEVRVTIGNFYQPGVRYYVMPVFANRAGGTFNALETVQEATPIMVANGSVKISYPIDRELASPKLARPPRLSFVLVRVSAGDEQKVVADTPDVSYAN